MMEWFKTFRKTTPRKTFDVNELLQQTVRGLSSTDRLSADEREYIARMVEALNGGARGVFLVEAPSGGIDYLIANDTHIGGMELLARFSARHIRKIQEASVFDE